MGGLKTTSPSHLCFLSIWKCALFLPRGSSSRAFIFSEPLASFRSFPSNSPGPWNRYEPFWWWTKARETVLFAVFKKERSEPWGLLWQFWCLSLLRRCLFPPPPAPHLLLMPFLGISAVLCRPHSERAGPFSTGEEGRGGHSFFCSLTANVCKYEHFVRWPHGRGFLNV